MGASPKLLLRVPLEIWIGIGLVLMVLLVFGEVRRNQFVNYDDPTYVLKNPHVNEGLTGRNVLWAFTSMYASNWHPLTWLSLQTDSQLLGTEPWGYHLTNLLLHAANVLLLFALLRRMTGAIWQSAMVAALFGLHPLRVESVAWITERKDVLSTLFWLLTIWAYVRYVERPGTGRYVTVIVLFGLGLMAKPMLVTLPFVLLLLDYWPLRRFGQGGKAGPATKSFPQLVLEKLPLFALAGAACIVTLIAQRRAAPSFAILPMSFRVANATISYVRYIGMMLWPAGLNVLYPYPRVPWPWWKVLAATVALAAASFAAWRFRRDRPYLLVGWLWYLGTLMPVIGLIQVGEQALADRYTYVPMIGIALLLAWLLADLGRRFHILPVVSAFEAMALLVFMSLTWLQVLYWQDTLALWRRCLEVNPTNEIAQNGMGGGLLFFDKEKEAEEAIAYFREAIRLNPAYPSPYSNLGSALSKLGQNEEALVAYRQALRFDPGHEVANLNLGFLLLQQNEVEEARDHFLKAARSNPDSEAAESGLGWACYREGKLAEAVAHFEKAVRLDPLKATSYGDWALALNRLGYKDRAREAYDKAMHLSHKWAEGANKWAWEYATASKPGKRYGQRAVELAEQVCQATQEKKPEYVDTLAAAYAEAGKFDEAVAACQKALALLPSKEKPELTKAIQARCQLYQKHMPYRDVPGRNQP